MYLLLASLCAFALSVFLMPLIISFAERRGLYDGENARKIHHGKIPRLGGVGIVAAFLVTICAATLITGRGAETQGRFWVVILCGALIPLLGLADDFRNLRARFKFAVELVAALAITAAGFRFRELALPFGSGALRLGAFSYPLTILWLIGVTNAVNLIDGMDGLAGGISVLAALGSGVSFLILGSAGGALIAFVLIGAILGFLRYNLPPAKIFMGDSGSLFLGFILATLPLIAPRSSVGEIAFYGAATMLLIPVYDTFSAMIRRARAHVSFFTPDRLHLHHKLLDLGLSTKGVLAVVYSAQLFLDGAALSLLLLPLGISFWLVIGTWVAFAGAFAVLDAWALRRPGFQPVAAATAPAEPRIQQDPEAAEKSRRRLEGTLVNTIFDDKQK